MKDRFRTISGQSRKSGERLIDTQSGHSDQLSDREIPSQRPYCSNTRLYESKCVSKINDYTTHIF